jgi:hypothetical protein
LVKSCAILLSLAFAVNRRASAGFVRVAHLQAGYAHAVGNEILLGRHFDHAGVGYKLLVYIFVAEDGLQQIGWDIACIQDACPAAEGDGGSRDIDPGK